MGDLWAELGEKIKVWGANWATYTALGSFALYLLGYLTLRFHLTVLGIGTDLLVLDERYLFTGARFLIYLVSSVPTVVLLTLLLTAVIYLPYRLLPSGIRMKFACLSMDWREGLRTWWSDPTRLALTGIILSVLIIQLVMRQCFFFSNLLLAPRLPQEPAWLCALLLAENDGLMALYFSGLVAGATVSVGLVLTLRDKPLQTARFRFLKGLLAFLVAVQILLLPVNYGILIVDKSMPRVADLGQESTLEQGAEAWLVWEGREGVTYLVRKKKDGKDSKALITLPQKDIKKIEITAYDRILRVLFADQDKQPGLQHDSKKEKPQ